MFEPYIIACENVVSEMVNNPNQDLAEVCAEYGIFNPTTDEINYLLMRITERLRW